MLAVVNRHLKNIQFFLATDATVIVTDEECMTNCDYAKENTDLKGITGYLPLIEARFR